MLGSVPLVKYGPRTKPRHLRKLLTGKGGVIDERKENDGQVEGTDKSKTSGGSKATSGRGSFISFWKPEVSKYLFDWRVVLPQSSSIFSIFVF